MIVQSPKNWRTKSIVGVAGRPAGSKSFSQGRWPRQLPRQSETISNAVMRSARTFVGLAALFWSASRIFCGDEMLRGGADASAISMTQQPLQIRNTQRRCSMIAAILPNALLDKSRSESLIGFCLGGDVVQTDAFFSSSSASTSRYVLSIDHFHRRAPRCQARQRDECRTSLQLA